MLANHRRREIGTVVAVVVIVNRCDEDGEKDEKRMGGRQSGVVSSVLMFCPTLEERNRGTSYGRASETLRYVE